MVEMEWELGDSTGRAGKNQADKALESLSSLGLMSQGQEVGEEREQRTNIGGRNKDDMTRVSLEGLGIGEKQDQPFD